MDTALFAYSYANSGGLWLKASDSSIVSISIWNTNFYVVYDVGNLKVWSLITHHQHVAVLRSEIRLSRGVCRRILTEMESFFVR